MYLDTSAFVTDPSLIETFQNQSRMLACDRDRVLFFQGEAPNGLYILSRGSATLTTSGPRGEFDITLQTSLPSLIGLPSLMVGAPHTYSVVVHSGAKLSYISLYEFALMIEFDQFLANKALDALANEMRVSQRAILDQLNVAAQKAA